MSFELLCFAVLAYLVFGPRKLPEIARTVAKVLAELRRAGNEFRYSLEDEIRSIDIAETRKKRIEAPPAPAVAGAVSRVEAAPAPESSAAPHAESPAEFQADANDVPPEHAVWNQATGQWEWDEEPQWDEALPETPPTAPAQAHEPAPEPEHSPAVSQT